MQYQEQVRGMIDLTQFFTMINGTNLFKGYPVEYVEHVYRKFIELIPVLNQIKIYK